MANRLETGAAGERIAKEYLRAKGYEILDANWSTTFGELDIVARQAGVLVFVEVKTRRGVSTEPALEAVTPAKHDRLLKAIYQYLSDHDVDPEAQWRVDVVAIAIAGNRRPRIDHVEDAFDW